MMHVVPIIEVVANDMPEKCENTHTCYKGTYAPRFGVSCDFSQSYASICLQCNIKVISNHLHSRCVPVEDCGECTMFGSSCRMSPEDEKLLRDVEHASSETHIIAKLSFKWFNDAARIAQDYAVSVGFKDLSSRERTPYKSRIEVFLKKSGYPPTLVETLIKALQNGIDIIKSDMLPKIWKFCDQHGISLDQFPNLPMHMIFLGIEKNIMSQTPVIYDRKRCKSERTNWTDLTDDMNRVRKAVNNLSLEWCMSMPFTGSLGVGSAGWESEHYVGFCRVSLVSFAQLDSACNDVEEKTKRILLAFKTARVLWFCLVSRVMADEKVDSTEVDRYATLFLSACKRFHECAKERYDQKAEEDAKKREEAARKRKNNQQNGSQGSSVDSSQANQKQKAPRERAPFYISAANYSNLKNLKGQIDFLGSLRDIWEGTLEGFIKFVKRELTTMRHDPAFMSTILKKLLQTHCIENISSNSSFGKKTAYARTSNVKPLQIDEDVSTVLDDNLALSGVVDKDGQAYLCARAGAAEGGGYKLYNIQFDDSKSKKIYDLHYAHANIAPYGPHRVISDATQLKQFSTDYILMVRREAKWTVLCRSWRVRNEMGEFSLLRASYDTLAWPFK